MMSLKTSMGGNGTKRRDYLLLKGTLKHQASILNTDQNTTTQSTMAVSGYSNQATLPKYASTARLPWFSNFISLVRLCLAILPSAMVF